MSNSGEVSVIILAAGKGTRMRSKMPKVLHDLAGRPLLKHVIDVAQKLQPDSINIVYGHGGDQVKESFSTETDLVWVEQKEQLGTGHAVEQAMPNIVDGGKTIVLYGDVPLTSLELLEELVQSVNDQTMGLITVTLDDPTGYGRIIRDSEGNLARIVEQKDASPDELLVDECNTGILAATTQQMRDWLSRLDDNNAQGEFYLTDVLAMARGEGLAVNVIEAQNEMEVMGVNNRHQLAELERFYQWREADRLTMAGVTLRDPGRFDIRGELKHGQDVTIDINVVVEGSVELGDDVEIGCNCYLKNVKIGNGVKIQPNCVLEDAIIGENSKIGPFARIRPETELSDSVHVGNFVEIKKSRVASGSKINHLSYIGDTVMGSKVNVGAGTITCNYDGAYKHQTTIGDNVFIGSNSQLVAPVELEDGATIGAGSTITKTAPANKLTLSRPKQLSINGWKRPQKVKK